MSVGHSIGYFLQLFRGTNDGLICCHRKIKILSGYFLFQVELNEKAELACQEKLKCNKVCNFTVLIHVPYWFLNSRLW